MSVAILASLAGFGWSADIPWRHHYATAKKESVARHLPMLIELSCPNCTWCQKLHQTTFRNPRVAQTASSKYVPVSVNAVDDPWLVQALMVDAFPTIIMADPNGDILYRHEGYLDARLMHQYLERAARAVKPRQATPIARVRSHSHQQVIRPVGYQRLVPQPVVQQPAQRMQASPYQTLTPPPAPTVVEQPAGEIVQATIEQVGQPRQVVPVSYPMQQVQPAAQAPVVVRSNVMPQSQYPILPPKSQRPPSQYETARTVGKPVSPYQTVPMRVRQEVVPVQYQQAPPGSMQPSQPTVTVREVSPIGPYSTGYAPVCKSPYAH